jgi:hypothetical protein
MGSKGVSDSGSNGKLPTMGYIMARSSFCSCSLCGAEKADEWSDVVLHSAVKEGRIVVEVIPSPTLLAATLPVESPLPARLRPCWKQPVFAACACGWRAALLRLPYCRDILSRRVRSY